MAYSSDKTKTDQEVPPPTPQKEVELGTVVSESHADVQDLNHAVVDHAIEAIGMGRYQWNLTISCGFGFVMLLVSIAMVMPQASKEFSPQYATLLSAALYAGLLVGAVSFGVLADLTGRRIAWQISIFGASASTMVCASSPNWAALNVFVAILGFFGGGNLALDLTVLAECLPRKWGYLLTGLASLWGLGSVITGLIAWPLVVTFSCPSGPTEITCKKADNMGWRYLYIILGGLCLVMSICRSFVLRMTESPKWLVTQGKLDDAGSSINTISRINKSTFEITTDHFHPIATADSNRSKWTPNAIAQSPLFHGSKQIRSLICLIALWFMMGIAYPVYIVFLPYYLEAHGARLGNNSTYQTYRDWSISSVVGICGPLLSAFLVRVPVLGRRRSITITACCCAVFAGAFTSVKSEAQNLAFSSMVNFWLNALYGIIYGYTPEAMPDKHRAIGCGITLAFSRIASLTAPFIATFANVTTSAPIWVCCALFIVIGLVSLVLPFEPKNVSSYD